MNNVTAYKVFLGSPDDLKSERLAFQKIVCKYNFRSCESRNVLVPVLWEYTSGGHGRAQGRINSYIGLCDYAIFMFGKTPGTNAGNPNGDTGTIEEYNESITLLKAKKIKQVVVFFKKVNLENPDTREVELFNEVLKLKERVKKEAQYMEFTNEDELENKLKDCFDDWSRPTTDKIKSVNDVMFFEKETPPAA
ncbi:MAG: hypothetical protein ACYC54_00865 [Sedimentisphaerales bacterium]